MYFYTYFGQNSYFKAITHQLKALKISLNTLNIITVKYKFCTIYTNVTKYDVTLATGGGLTPNYFSFFVL